MSIGQPRDAQQADLCSGTGEQATGIQSGSSLTGIGEFAQEKCSILGIVSLYLCSLSWPHDI